MATKQMNDQTEKSGCNNRPENRKKSNNNKKRNKFNKRVNYDNIREDKLSRDVGRAITKAADNDVTWYAHSPEMLRAAASLPTYSVVGNFTDWNQAVPGAMAVYWDQAYGGNRNAAINQAKESLYSYVVHANSRNQSYDSSDLMLIILAGMNVFNAMAHVIRAYGIAKYYSEMNVYLPEGLLKLMGFDPSDVRMNLSQMWFDINELIAQTSQIWIPNEMPVITRQFWMCTNIYTDSDSYKPQYYLYVPRHFYQYYPTAFTDGGALLPATSGNSYFDTMNNQHSWAQWKAMLQGLIDALLTDQDRGIMFGDILKAYGTEKLYHIAPIPVDYRVTPVYSAEVLSQFENVLVTGWSAPCGLKQNTDTDNTLVQLWSNDEKITNTWNISSTTVLNFHGTTPPDPGAIMVATRMHRAGDVLDPFCKVLTPTFAEDGVTWAATTKSTYVPYSTGTEVATGIMMCARNESNVADKSIKLYQFVQIKKAASGSSPSYEYRELARWAAFDWAPWWYVTPTSAPTTSIPGQSWTKLTQAIGDYDIYTTVVNEELDKMHTAAVYSEFGVPFM